jgi:hypothetical protein
MKARKSTTQRSKPKVLTWFERDAIERQKETEEFIAFGKKLLRDPARCRRILQEAGIYTKSGRLTKRYR